MSTIKSMPTHIKEDTIAKKIWQDHCPVHLDRISVVEVSYVDFEGVVQVGELMVFDVLAESVVQIFASLFEMKFPIAQIQLINNYAGDDDKSMADNNSSAFNCRRIKGTDRYSMHSYGMAIDINPVQNPYVYKGKDGKVTIYPEEGDNYLCRDEPVKGMLTEEVVEIFSSNHFTGWGGNWSNPDWQHFEISKGLMEALLGRSYDEGVDFLQ